MNRPAFAPGFRLSAMDLAILLVGTALSGGLSLITAWAAFVVAFVVMHFFLFCNVFRISRRLELAWAAVFIGLAAGTVLFEMPGWLVTVAASLAATSVVVMLEMRKPSYHGVYWQRVNPQLREWWEKGVTDRPDDSLSGGQESNSCPPAP